MNADCCTPINSLRSLPTSFWNQELFGVIVGLRVMKGKLEQFIALKFDTETDSIVGLQILGSSIYSILESMKNQEEYNDLSLSQVVPLKYTLYAAKLLAQDSPAMSGLKDPLQLAIMNISSQSIEIEKLKKDVRYLVDDRKRGNINANRLNNVNDVVMKSNSEKIIYTRIETLEKVLQVLLPSKKRTRDDPLTMESILKRIDDLESNVKKLNSKPKLLINKSVSTPKTATNKDRMIICFVVVIMVVAQPHLTLNYKVLLHLSLLQAIVMIIVDWVNQFQLIIISIMVDQNLQVII